MKLNVTLKWCVALTAAILLFYWKLFFPSQFTLLDGAEAVKQGYSWLHFWMRSVRAGSLPIWDPYALCGYSFPGEMQTGAFYPLYLIFLLMPLGPNGLLSSMEYNLFILLTHVLAALFMFALARELGLSRFAAFISGLCFSTGSFTGHVGWPHMLGSSIWLPLIFLYLVRALRSTRASERVFFSSMSGSLLGMSLLAGGLHIAMAQTIVVVTAIAFQALSRDASKSSESARRSAFWLPAQVGAVILLTAFCAAAVQLLPSHVYAGRSIRFLGPYALPSTQMIPYEDVSGSVLSPAGLLSVLLPVFDGMGQGEIWSPYIGVLPFAFACIGIAKCWSSIWVRYLAGLSLAAMLYALGGLSALHGLLYALVPWLWMAREASRFIYLTGFGLAVLAGFGIDAFISRLASESAWSSFERALTKAMVGCSIALFAVLLFSKPGTSWIFWSLLMVLASCGLLRFGLWRKQARAGWLLLAASLVFFDLNASNWLVASKIDADRANRNELTVLTSMEGVVHFLKARPGIFRVSVYRDPTPNLGDAFGIQNTSGAGVTFENYFEAVRGRLELLNSRYIIKPASAVDPNPVYQDGSWKVYENPKAFPRSWLIHETKFQPDDGKVFRALGQNDMDFHKVAFLSAPMTSNIAGDPQSSSESVSIRSYTANRITAAVHTENPALVVFSELFYPGWYASVNGKEATILRANGAFRSVVVPRGESTVELFYRPASVYLGAFLTCLAWIATLVSFLLLRFKGRNLSDPNSSESIA